MKRSDLKPGTVFVYAAGHGGKETVPHYVPRWDERCTVSQTDCWLSIPGRWIEREVRVLWEPPAATKPKRKDLKPGTVFRYLDGPSANWEMYVPVETRDSWGWPCQRQHKDTPANLKNARSSLPGSNDHDKEVEVLWSPPEKPAIVPPVKTPPVVNKGLLALKIQHRPRLDGLANGLKRLDYEAQAAKLRTYPYTGPQKFDVYEERDAIKKHAPTQDFVKIGKWTGKPEQKVPPPLPTDDKARKALPVFTGPLMYFPHALLQVGAVCKAGNDQHNPGEPMHWARGKSTDQLNTALRHMMDHGLGNTRDTDGQYHLAKAAWRILAELQLTIERDLNVDRI